MLSPSVLCGLRFPKRYGAATERRPQKARLEVTMGDATYLIDVTFTSPCEEAYAQRAFTDALAMDRERSKTT